MRKIYFLLTIVIALGKAASAQFYSSGDISVSLMPVASHDSSLCMSQGQMMYNITIANSFMGDSVAIIDMLGGFLVYQEVNTTGANPWILTVPVFNAFGMVPDDQLNNGMAFFGGPMNKMISGSDTIYDIANFYNLYVPDPCVYGNVSGKVYVDYNNDCMFNGNDVPLTAVGVSIAETLNSPLMTNITYGTNSNGFGNYYVNIMESWMTNFTVSIPSYYQFIFPSTVCSPPSYSFTTLPQANADFALQCSGNTDLQCSAGSQGVVRPNLPFFLYPNVSNTGCDSVSGELKLVLDPNVIYNAGLSTNPANTVSGDTLIWYFTNLTSLSNGAYWNSFLAQVHLTPTAAVTVGDTVCFRIFTHVPANDVNAYNNDYSFCLPVVNSYDPNFKEVNPKGTGVQGYIPTTTNELSYTIHFQNTGTAVAFNISIIDTLDANLDPNSLVITGNSHSVIPVWLAPGVVKFYFGNIYLADSTSNELESHGFVQFHIRLNASLPAGTVIQNNAGIYFDSNPAVITNTVTNTLAVPSGIAEHSNFPGLSVHPNPFTFQTTITFNDEQRNTTVTIMDLLGNEIRSYLLSGAKSLVLEKGEMSKGIYFIHATDEKKNIFNQKIVVE